MKILKYLFISSKKIEKQPLSPKPDYPKLKGREPRTYYSKQAKAMPVEDILDLIAETWTWRRIKRNAIDLYRRLVCFFMGHRIISDQRRLADFPYTHVENHIGCIHCPKFETVKVQN